MLKAVVRDSVSCLNHRRSRGFSNGDDRAAAATVVVAVPGKRVTGCAGRVRYVHRSRTAAAAIIWSRGEIEAAYSGHRNRRRVSQAVEDEAAASRNRSCARGFSNGDDRAAAATVVVAVPGKRVTGCAGRVRYVHRSRTAAAAIIRSRGEIEAAYSGH